MYQPAAKAVSVTGELRVYRLGGSFVSLLLWEAVFAFHRPERWEVAGVEIRGAIYHAAEIDDGRITRIGDYADRAEVLAAAGLGDD